ncbi:hypothetical protein [Micromonospora sp. NPDC092111]
MNVGTDSKGRAGGTVSFTPESWRALVAIRARRPDIAARVRRPDVAVRAR